MSVCVCVTFICVVYTEVQIICTSCVLHCTLYSSTEYLYMNLYIKSAMCICVCVFVSHLYEFLIDGGVHGIRPYLRQE